MGSTALIMAALSESTHYFSHYLIIIEQEVIGSVTQSDLL